MHPPRREHDPGENLSAEGPEMRPNRLHVRGRQPRIKCQSASAPHRKRARCAGSETTPSGPRVRHPAQSPPVHGTGATRLPTAWHVACAPPFSRHRAKANCRKRGAHDNAAFSRRGVPFTRSRNHFRLAPTRCWMCWVRLYRTFPSMRPPFVANRSPRPKGR